MKAALLASEERVDKHGVYLHGRQEPIQLAALMKTLGVERPFGSKVREELILRTAERLRT
jgi:hypothetical protein